MPDRKFKPRIRASKVRDAKLIIIAAEGTQTEKRYFDDLAFDDRYRNPKVHVEVLERTSTTSAPEHVISELDSFRRTYSLNDHDELWLVIDLDRWGSEKLSDISTQCIQKSYLLAVSNPCFEVWLLLHITALDQYTHDEVNELAANRKLNGRTQLEKELLTLCGKYDKSNLDTSQYLPYVETAIMRAKELDINPEHRWPNQLGTRVYLLAESIIRKYRL